MICELQKGLPFLVDLLPQSTTIYSAWNDVVGCREVLEPRGHVIAWHRNRVLLQAPGLPRGLAVRCAGINASGAYRQTQLTAEQASRLPHGRLWATHEYKEAWVGYDSAEGD